MRLYREPIRWIKSKWFKDYLFPLHMRNRYQSDQICHFCSERCDHSSQSQILWSFVRSKFAILSQLCFCHYFSCFTKKEFFLFSLSSSSSSNNNNNLLDSTQHLQFQSIILHTKVSNKRCSHTSTSSMISTFHILF